VAAARPHHLRPRPTAPAKAPSVREHKELAAARVRAACARRGTTMRRRQSLFVLLVGRTPVPNAICLRRQAPFGRCWTPAGGVGCQRWELLDPDNDTRTWKGLFWEVEAAAPARVSGGRRRMSSANIRGGYGASGARAECVTGHKRHSVLLGRIVGVAGRDSRCHPCVFERAPLGGVRARE
jgi:hypothetical protein